MGSIKRRQAPRWLTLCGTNGNGKTHCAKRCWQAIVADHRQEFAGCLYNRQIIHWPSFVQDLRGGDGYGMLRDLRSWPYLVIDEMGGERDTTGFSAEQIATLLCCRVGRWTLITTNLSIDAVEKFDRRIASRMFRNGGIVVECLAQDYSMRTDSKL